MVAAGAAVCEDRYPAAAVMAGAVTAGVALMALR
jgi:hypothetical protein